MHAIKIELLVDLLFSWIILCTGKLHVIKGYKEPV